MLSPIEALLSLVVFQEILIEEVTPVQKLFLTQVQGKTKMTFFFIGIALMLLISVFIKTKVICCLQSAKKKISQKSFIFFVKDRFLKEKDGLYRLFERGFFKYEPVPICTKAFF